MHTKSCQYYTHVVAVVTDEGGSRYKPLIDADYIPSEVVEKLEELSNPDTAHSRRKSKSKRGSVQIASGGNKRKTSSRNLKIRTPQK